MSYAAAAVAPRPAYGGCGGGFFWWATPWRAVCGRDIGPVRAEHSTGKTVGSPTRLAPLVDDLAGNLPSRRRDRPRNRRRRDAVCPYTQVRSVGSMRTGDGLLALLVRLVSGRLLRDIGAFARREVRLVVVAVIGVVGFLTFLLGAAAMAVVVLYTVLAPWLGPLQSLAVLIGATLVVALVSLLIAMRAAKAFTRWEGMRLRPAVPTASTTRRRPQDSDASLALLISLVLQHLTSASRRAPR